MYKTLTELANAIDDQPMTAGTTKSKMRFFLPNRSTNEATMSEPTIAPNGMKLPIHAISSFDIVKP